MEKSRDTGQIELARLWDRATPEQIDAVVGALRKVVNALLDSLTPALAAEEAELVRLRRIEVTAMDLLDVVRSLRLKGLPGPLRMRLDTFDSLARALGSRASSLQVAAPGLPALAPGVACGEPARYRCGWDHEPGVTTDVCNHHRMTRRYGGTVGDVPPGARCQAVGDIELGQG